MSKTEQMPAEIFQKSFIHCPNCKGEWIIDHLLDRNTDFGTLYCDQCGVGCSGTVKNGVVSIWINENEHKKPCTVLLKLKPTSKKNNMSKTAIPYRSNNEKVPFTRRIPNLSKKKERNDSAVAEKIIIAWDVKRDEKLVLTAFLNGRRLISDYRYWELLRSVWIICGSVENTPLFRELFTSKRKHRDWFSTPEEHHKLNLLPEIVTVYRATNSRNDNGISWTLSKDYALYYQKEFSRSTILDKQVNRSEIFALINRNREEEVIIL